MRHSTRVNLCSRCCSSRHLCPCSTPNSQQEASAACPPSNSTYTDGSESWHMGKEQSPVVHSLSERDRQVAQLAAGQRDEPADSSRITQQNFRPDAHVSLPEAQKRDPPMLQATRGPQTIHPLVASRPYACSSRSPRTHIKYLKSRTTSASAMKHPGYQ